MAAVTDFIYRISGLVTFTDNSTQVFEVTHQNGITSQVDSSGSLEAFKQLYADESSLVNALKALLPGTHTLTPAAPSTALTVSDFHMLVTGRASYADNTWDDFEVVYQLGGNTTIGDVSAETRVKVLNLAAVDAIWELLVGAGNATTV